MKVSQPNLYPESFVTWLANQGDSRIHAMLRGRIATRLSETNSSFSTKEITQQKIDEIDQQYFDLKEQGKSAESITLFSQARLFSASMLLDAGNLENALYEYYHSVDVENPEEIIADLEKV